MRKQKRTPLREKIADAAEIPKEVALSLPKITVLAGKEASVENYKGIISLDTTCIRLYTAAGILCLSGEGLDISAMTGEDIYIQGVIRKIEFE
ncbi:MAG: YabP/YqfC family sporulation protein [Clostridia bacterium]|nr:YabP/YqfC family sporulation protein [Clostridia bacterium]